MIKMLKLCTSILSAVLIATALSFTMTSCSDSDSDESPVLTMTDPVTTAQGDVRGVVTQGMNAYKGIPYAAPPAGSLRFAPPADPADRGDDVLDATTFCSNCPQVESDFGAGSTNEDCLYLNIFTPTDAESGDDKAVMVWIHGGAFIYGSGSDSGYNARYLVEKDVIVVTINYRLGALGFLPLAALAAEQSGHAGNYGLLDQRKALEWIQANIAAFGGDPDNVTIFGESAGGHSVLSHLVMDDADPPFQKAIVQSGAFYPDQVDQDLPLYGGYAMFGDPFLTITGISGTDAEIRTALRAMSVVDILSAQSTFLSSGGPTMYMPVYNANNQFLKSSISANLAAGTFADVPVMSGCNLNEGQLFVFLDIVGGTTYSTQDEYCVIDTSGADPVATAGAVYDLLIANPFVSTAEMATIATDYLNDAITELGAADHADRFRVALSKIWTDYVFAYNTQAQWVDIAERVAEDTSFAYWFTDVDAPDNSYEFYSTLLGGHIPFGATHSLEIQYVFGHVGARGGTTAQVALSETMMDYWTNFAKNGAPGTGWSAFDDADGGDAVVRQLDTDAEDDVTLDDFCAEHNCSYWTTIFTTP